MVANVGSLGKTTTHGYRRESLGEDRDRKLCLGWEEGGRKGERRGKVLHSRYSHSPPHLQTRALGEVLGILQ